MAKVNRERVVAEALALLDESGLDGVSTRRLAQRLGVEQPSLYWHFRRKEDLLAAMAAAALAPLGAAPLPAPEDDWRAWFLDNYRRFRSALLAHRDGARLHAGTFPSAEDLGRLQHKFDFLVAAGVPEDRARTALLAASRFTVGSALEEQSDLGAEPPEGVPVLDHAALFEAGLALMADGLAAGRQAVRPGSGSG